MVKTLAPKMTEAAESIIQLLIALDKHSNRIHVDTPLGTLIAKPSGGEPDYPGISIDLRRNDKDHGDRGGS